MTQVSPTTVLSDQASILVDQLLDAYKSGAIRDLDEISAKLREIVTGFLDSAGQPLAAYEPVVLGEPPSSAKMNRFNENVMHDVNIMQRQSDFLRASALFSFNTMATEIGLAKNENEKLRNKLKTLQLYSGNSDPSVVTFSEGFSSDDYFDLEKVTGSRTAILENAYLTLGRQGALVTLSKNASVSILDTSNGFTGNNLEVTKDEVKDSEEPSFVFVGDKLEIDKLNYINDEIPYSWFEYSAYKVRPIDRQGAGNFNFEYDAVAGSKKVNWAKGPTDGSDSLKLGLQIAMPQEKIINTITYVPHGMQDNVNHPVLVRKVQTSTDGTNWQPVVPSEIWVGTNQNVQSQRSAANFSIGSTAWSFPERSARYVQIFVEQPYATKIKLGHTYYVDAKTNNRVQGPNPPINNPRKYNNQATNGSNKYLQKREYFDAERFGIGIRDISVQQVKYDVKSTYVSKPIYVSGTVDRVALDADIFIPPSFGSTDSWVNFYISGDDGETWEQISRITDDYLAVPEVIAFNDPTPDAFKETGVMYAQTKNPVSSVRVKIELSRPANLTWSSPLVRSYDLRMVKK